MPEQEYNDKLTFYRATESNSGGAISLELRKDNSCGFISAAKQLESIVNESGQKYGKYDWENKINIKVELTDIGEMLAVFGKRQKEGKLYHKFGSDVKMVNVSSNEKGFDIRVSASKENYVSMRMSNGEGALMYAALSEMVPKLLKWD